MSTIHERRLKEIALLTRENAKLTAERDALQSAHADARTLLMWVSDCWQDGELRPDFDDCVDAIRDFLWERNVK